MKTFYSIGTIILVLFFFACKKEVRFNAIVVKDCTGTYLQIDKKDYHVCNPEIAEAIDNGTKVFAIFGMLKECTGSAAGAIVCDMYHPNEGWIEVKQIKPLK